jgi:EAL domain-containing protein (putative c-di-GMP-specific phosphodiesterase class I)
VARRVTLEITERAALEGMGDLPERLAALRRLGFRIAIDDLGAGYSGLSSFALLAPDAVKLDLSLIRGVDRDPTKQLLVKSMAQLCRDLQILVVSEGVETAVERDMLATLGCDLMQGYLFARPGPPFPCVNWGV